MKLGALITTLGAAAMLAACASPTSRFYTLGGDDARPVPTTAASFYFELAPIDMPQQVAKNQLVVQTSPAQVQVLEEERWASLPGDEVRRALSADLTQQLGAIDVYNTPRPASVPVYRVKVNVQRFESWPGTQALLDAVWSVRAAGSDSVLTCRTVARERVDAGYDALVAGHRKAVDELASAISAGVRSVSTLPAATSATVAPVASSKGKSGASTRSAAPPMLPCPATSTSATASAR